MEDELDLGFNANRFATNISNSRIRLLWVDFLPRTPNVVTWLLHQYEASKVMYEAVRINICPTVVI